MNVKDTKIVESDETQSISQPLDKSRRSFAKKSAALAPVIMTLANRSAWGGTNMCSQSGFTSYHAAGAVVSHAAHVKNTNWKSPSAWAAEATWPNASGLGQATFNSPGFTSPLWIGSLTLTNVKLFESSNNVIVLRQTFNGSNNNNTVTVLAALSLSSTNAEKLKAFQLATVLNNAVSPVPSYFLTGSVTLSEFQTFYNNCV